MLNTKLLGGTASAPATYVEDVFSTWLTTGAGANITVNNGIDLAGKGGMVWQKTRTSAGANTLFDTARGANYGLFSNATNAQSFSSNWLPTFNSNGFVIGTDNNLCTSGTTGVNWTFRKAPKFFDVVTYTGNGAGAQTISHNLGSTPGMIIVKNTSATGAWWVYHRGLADASNKFLRLDSANAAGDTGTPTWNPTSTTFSASETQFSLNTTGATYVAYLFAHDAGGFGTAGTDNVISCGSFTVDGTGKATVNLGYEPQYLMIKPVSGTYGTGNWQVMDVMRGFSQTNSQLLRPNTSGSEVTTQSGTLNDWAIPTATGFNIPTNLDGVTNTTYIYMAIRRPMKPPTSGTEVFSPIAATTGVQTTGFTIDSQLLSFRGGNAITTSQFVDRLRGVSTTTTELGRYLITSSTAAESNTYANSSNSWNNTGFKVPQNYDGTSSVFYSFRRASGFFDVVCYTGTGSARTVTHNLGVVPELMIVKGRSVNDDWSVYSQGTGNTDYLILNSTAAKATGASFWNNTSPTSSVFSLGTNGALNSNGGTFVSYLFATLAGVSKVFSYTGNGSSQTINCAFTAGARLVLIKRTDSTGDWYIWDSARGIVSGNDPRLSLNSTAAEVTSDDTIDPDSSGFVVNQVAATNVNVSSATYIGLAIA